ncbi:hypothetical protein PanWU01x14_199190, partial [Parasponia andersonii]
MARKHGTKKFVPSTIRATLEHTKHDRGQLPAKLPYTAYYSHRRSRKVAELFPLKNAIFGRLELFVTGAILDYFRSCSWAHWVRLVERNLK